MKIMFISDIHGVKTNLDIIRKRFNELACDKLVVLGDLYYIYPIYRIIKDYDVAYIKDFLESFKDKLIVIRGNCDSDMDVKMSNFPIINDIKSISVDNLDIYLTHGHIYNEHNWNKNNSILIFGHYHIPFIKEKNNMIFINPGSISFPKENNNPSYLIYSSKEFIIYDIYGDILAKKEVK